MAIGTGEIDWEEKYMYLYADFLNYKRRKEEEVSNAKKDGEKILLIKMLDFFDTLDKTAGQCRYFMEMEALMSKFEQTISDIGLETFGEVGEKFDSDKHNAMKTTDGNIYGEGNISGVYRKGYTYNSNIIRHADVSVEINNGNNAE